MIIKEISLLNFRNLKEYHKKFTPYTNIIVGKNGTGKTSVLEAIFFSSTTKSFRKKHNTAIIKAGEKALKIKALFFNTKEKEIKLTYNGKTKNVYKNNKHIKKTTELLKEIDVVCVSPEETDIIEGYKKTKQQYFDRIIFKTNPTHTIDIKKYNKLLLYRNTLLENKMETKIWDEKLITTGIKTTQPHFLALSPKKLIVEV